MPSEAHEGEAEQTDEAIKSQISPTTNKRNAFSELMSAKPKQLKQQQQHKQMGRLSNPKDPRSGLLPYILDPTKFPSDIVIQHNENTVLIRDAFPKATVHLLLLPRDSMKWDLNPRDAFGDEAFLELIRNEAAE